MQIIFRATTAGVNAAGAVITTNAVQVLPPWAPPISYIGTTTPWFAFVIGGSTTPYAATAPKANRVRSYGRKATLHSGREVVGLARATRGAKLLEAGSNHIGIIILTYRAIGELTRP